MFQGQPVSVFGIVTLKSFSDHWTPGTAGIDVRSPTGRFDVRLPPGTWDLLVAGPGFATHVLVGKTLEAGAMLELGEVVVKDGFEVVGQVTDQTNTPVVGAEVTLLHDFAPNDGSTIAYAFGNHRTTTDANGRYSFRGVSQTKLTGGATLRAWGPDFGSFPQSIASGNVTVNLQVEPAGSIEGNLESEKEVRILVRPLGGRRRGLIFALGKSPSLKIEGLPAGMYEVHVEDRPPQRPIVTAGQTTFLAAP